MSGPVFGLNNLAIPESLNQQDYWYRTEFTAPAAFAGRELMLEFKGINYYAEVWLNGEYLGHITGAFIRGQFAVTRRIKPGGGECAGGHGGAAARPRRAERAVDEIRAGRQWRRVVPGRADLCLHGGVGLDSGHPGPLHGSVAGRGVAGERAGDPGRQGCRAGLRRPRRAFASAGQVWGSHFSPLCRRVSPFLILAMGELVNSWAHWATRSVSRPRAAVRPRVEKRAVAEHRAS